MFDKYMSTPPVILNEVSSLLLQKFQLEPKLSSLCLLAEQVPPTGGLLLAEYIRSPGWGKVWLELFHEQLLTMNVESTVENSNTVFADVIQANANNYFDHTNEIVTLKVCMDFLARLNESYNLTFNRIVQQTRLGYSPTPHQGYQPYTGVVKPIDPNVPIALILTNGAMTSLVDYLNDYPQLRAHGLTLTSVIVGQRYQRQVEQLMAKYNITPNPVETTYELMLGRLITQFVDGNWNPNICTQLIVRWPTLVSFVEDLKRMNVVQTPSQPRDNKQTTNEEPQETPKSNEVLNEEALKLKALGNGLRTLGVTANQLFSDKELGQAWLSSINETTPEVRFFAAVTTDATKVKAIIELTKEYLGQDGICLPKSYCSDVVRHPANRLPQIQAKISGSHCISFLEVARAVFGNVHVEVMVVDRRGKSLLSMLVSGILHTNTGPIYLTDLNEEINEPTPRDLATMESIELLAQLVDWTSD